MCIVTPFSLVPRNPEEVTVDPSFNCSSPAEHTLQGYGLHMPPSFWYLCLVV